MPELLFELGCEELPAGSVAKAAQELSEAVIKRLSEAGVPMGSVTTKYTPRRLVTSVADVADRQPDQEATVRGPSLKAAYDSEGKATKALEGFCRGQGADLAQVTDDAEYVWVTKRTGGRPTAELLAEYLPAAVQDVSWPKTMRWADGTLRFARPIRWILAVFDGQTVPFAIEGVASGATSTGHRFWSTGTFEAKCLTELDAGLTARNVRLDQDQRAAAVRSRVLELAGEAPEELVVENANLTEWPEVHLGEFKPEFLELPDPVLTTVMAKHERFFPVRDGQGRLTNRFVAVRNGGVEDVVREGNAWVLNARFNDARFFYEEDRKHTLEDFLERTAQMSYHDALGNVRQRAERLSSLTSKVALWSGADAEEAAWAAEAGRLAKADLTTGLVSELDELQGVVGGEYARSEGRPDAVCWAVWSHYDLTRNEQADCAGARTALRLTAADQLDKLAGFLGIGKVPSGSSDPFGLRRAANMLIQIALRDWPSRPGSFLPAFDAALEGYARQGVVLDTETARSSFLDLLDNRYASYDFDGAPYHVVDAAKLEGASLADPRAVRFRVLVMSAFAQDADFVRTALRPTNIVSAAVKKGALDSSKAWDEDGLQSDEGSALWAAVVRQRPLAEQACQAEDKEGLIAAVRPLAAPIDAFFDSTMVMVDDPAVRNARLGMLAECDAVFKLAGDFTKVVIPG